MQLAGPQAGPQNNNLMFYIIHTILFYVSTETEYKLITK
jgi:hypothetical protein